MQQVKAQNVNGASPPVLPVVDGNWANGGWRIRPTGPSRREHVVGCWVKCNPAYTLNTTNTRAANFAVNDYNQNSVAGYQSLRSYFEDRSDRLYVQVENYQSGGQKALSVDVPYIDGMGGVDTHWVHLFARISPGTVAYWFVNGKYLGTNSYQDLPTYTTDHWGLVQSIFGRRYGGAQDPVTCFVGSVYNWFCADDTDYRAKFGFGYDDMDEYVKPWIRNAGDNLLVPVTDEDMPSRADAMANMYLGCHLTAGPSGVIQVNGYNSGQEWFTSQSWSMTGKDIKEMPVFGYDMRT